MKIHSSSEYSLHNIYPISQVNPHKLTNLFHLIINKAFWWNYIHLYLHLQDLRTYKSDSRHSSEPEFRNDTRNILKKTMTEILVKHINSALSINNKQVLNTVKLLEEGAMSLCELYHICTIYFCLKL